MPENLQMQDARQAGARRDGATWTAFLIIAFAVLGLVGAFGVFAAQIPFERALARSMALDEALAASQAPDAAAKLDALRPALDDSASHIIGPPGPMAEKIAAERVRMLTAFGREARDIGVRLRLVIAVFAAACAVFGVAVLSIVRRAT
jgi:nitrate reductase NapE component